VAELRRAIVDHECLYGMTSEGAAAALARGELEDTPDVAIWMIEYHTLEMLTS
jgi:hypothetical protein